MNRNLPKRSYTYKQLRVHENFFYYFTLILKICALQIERPQVTNR